MSGEPCAPNKLHPPAVVGLEGGRDRARRRAGRRRAKNSLVSGVMFLVVAGTVGAAGYFVWQFYQDEQAPEPEGPVVERTADEIIDHLEEQPRWNGPGSPAFGVGDDQP